jgi:hypothetical protein
MKNKFIISSVGIALLAITFIWFQPKKKGELALLVPSSSSGAVVTNVTISIAQPHQRETNVMRMQPHLEPLETNSTAMEQKAKAILKSRNVPIDFWGKVIDQDGTPLSNVSIESKIRRWDFAAKINPDGTITKKETTTGSDGQFHIDGDSGDDLSLKLQKDGYVLEPNAKTGFGYGTAEQFTASQENPLIFRMWKTNIHEQLVNGDKRFQIVPDGRTYVIDLSTGTISESGGGDLKVWIKYQPMATGSQLYDWSSEIDVINGGLLEETDDYSSMYSAPVDGYTPVFQYPQTPRQLKSGQRGRSGQHRFYVILENGKEYGRIKVDLVAPYNDTIPGLIEIQYAINPTGSRILR